jgi:hypothetical protein
MFAEPLTISVNAVAKSLQRISSGDQRGVFKNATEGLKLTISHSETNAKRQRKVVRLDHAKNAVDPLLTGVSRPVSASVTLTADFPLVGYTSVEFEDYLEALAVWLSVQGNRDKLVNGES